MPLMSSPVTRLELSTQGVVWLAKIPPIGYDLCRQVSQFHGYLPGLHTGLAWRNGAFNKEKALWNFAMVRWQLYYPSLPITRLGWGIPSHSFETQFLLPAVKLRCSSVLRMLFVTISRRIRDAVPGLKSRNWGGFLCLDQKEVNRALACIPVS